MKKLSVTIVTYNSEKDIFPCLDTIHRYNDIGEDLEVIIVDNKSTNFAPTEQRLLSDYPSVRILHNTHNGGYGEGNNIGIRAASSPIILIMNPDVRLIEPIFQQALTAFEQDPTLSLLGLQQMLTPTQKGNSFHPIRSLSGWWIVLNTILANKCGHYNPRTMWFSGSCFFIRKEHFCTIGLFDERNFMYAEEEDIHYRLLKQYGPHMRFMPSLHYIHPPKQTQPSASYQQRILDAEIYVLAKQGLTRAQVIKRHISQTQTQLCLTRWAAFFGLRTKDDVIVMQQQLTALQNML